MTTVTEIESAIERLPDRDLHHLSGWFDAYLNRKWDEQMERDAASGALDFLAEEAREAKAKGTLRSFP